MANINIENLNVIGGEQQTVGDPVQVEATINNREVLSAGGQAGCTVESDGFFGGYQGHRAEVRFSIAGETESGEQISESMTSGELCVPIETADLRNPNSTVQWDFTVEEPAVVDLEVTVVPLPSGTGQPDTVERSVVVGSPGGEPSPGDDGGDVTDPTDGSIYDPSNAQIFQTAIENPVGTLVFAAGASIALKQAFGGD